MGPQVQPARHHFETFVGGRQVPAWLAPAGRPDGCALDGRCPAPACRVGGAGQSAAEAVRGGGDAARPDIGADAGRALDELRMTLGSPGCWWALPL